MKRYNRIFSLLMAVSVLLPFVACDRAALPDNAQAVEGKVSISPDYGGVTIPVNIAPLNFEIEDQADDYVSHVHLRGQKGLVSRGKKTDFDVNRWSQLLSEAHGDTLLLDIYTCDGGRWRRHPVMRLAVADAVDPYISYRLIEPSYIGFEVMKICQRDLRNFEEKEIFNNCATSENESGQCINCHSYQDYNRQGNMQFHVRLNNGGTVMVHDGEVRKVDLKTPATISAGVYPSWHPTLPIIAYSNNNTVQNFHSADRNKIEVQDGASDLILYEIDKNQVSIVANDSTEFETFPYWSADGRWLYYVSATVPLLDEEAMRAYRTHHYRDIKYNIYRKPFDEATRTFGATDTVFMASEHGGSATFPRPSRDGRYLLFTMAPYGTFHIWHRDADLFLLDLESGEARNMAEVNSDDVESYHSWSSNGQWILFSSRRDDGSYTRLYLTHFADGKASKPFLLPQRDPDHNKQRYKSYNVPEFMAEPVSVSRGELMRVVREAPLPAQLR